MDAAPQEMTAADALASIHTTLKTLAGPNGLCIIPADTRTRTPTDPPAAPHEADLHALSRAAPGRMRRALRSALRALRAAAAARESWDPERSDRLLRVKRDTVAKKRLMRSSRDALQACRKLAITADPFATTVALTIQRLRALAEDTGATTAEDAAEGEPGKGGVKKRDCLLTVCGAKFLADFHFFDVAAAEVRVKVKFRHLTAGDTEVGDGEVDADFARLIQEQDFSSLRKAFERLIEQERLGEALGADVSLTDALHSFEDDLLAAQDAERNAGLPDDVRLRLGHGLVARSALGLTISFMDGHSALLRVEDASPPREISTGRAHPTVAPQVLPSAVPLFDFADGQLQKLSAQYVLAFQTPIVVCLTVAQNLEKVGGLGEEALQTGGAQSVVLPKGGSNGSYAAHKDGQDDDAGGSKPHWPSLQKLLAPLVFGNQVQTDLDPSGSYGNGGSLQTAAGQATVKKRMHWSQQATEYIAASLLPDDQYIEFSHSGVDVISGLAIHRVPLCHPRNVKPIFALIRQQIVFNELFQSCFGAPVSVKSKLTPFQAQPVEVVLYDSPSFMQFNLYDDSIDDILSLAVGIELGGDISVTVKPSRGRPHVCSDAKATAILRACRSIPLTILTIERMSASAAAMRK